MSSLDDDKDEIITKLKAKMKKLQNDNKKLKSKLDDLDDSIEEREDTIEKLKKEIKNRGHSTMSSDNDRTDILEQELSEKQNEIDELICQMKRSEDAVEQLQEKNDMLEETIFELKEENKLLITSLQQENASQLSDIAKKDKKIRKLSDKVDELTHRLHLDLTEKESIIKKLSIKIEKLENEDLELSNSENSNSLPDSGFKNNDDTIKRYNADPDLISKVDEFQKGLTEISSLAGCKIKSMADCVLLLKRKSKEQIKSKTESDNEESFNDNEVIRQFKIRLDDQIEEIEELNMNIKDLKKRAKKKDKEFKSKLLEKQEVIDDLQDEIDETNQRKSKLVDRKKIKEFEETIEELEDELETVNDELKKKDRKLKDYEQQMDALIVEKEGLVADDIKKTKELKTLKVMNSELEQKLKAFQVDIDKTVVKDNAMLEMLKNEKEKLTQALNKSNDTVEIKQAAITTMRTKLGILKVSESDLKCDMAEMVATIEDYKIEINAMKEKYEQLNTLYNDHKRRNDELEELVSNQERELNLNKKDNFRQGVGQSSFRNRNNTNTKTAPLWWKNHQENGLQEVTEFPQEQCDTEKVCPNCNMLIKKNELQQHVKNCLAST